MIDNTGDSLKELVRREMAERLAAVERHREYWRRATSLEQGLPPELRYLAPAMERTFKRERRGDSSKASAISAVGDAWQRLRDEGHEVLLAKEDSAAGSARWSEYFGSFYQAVDEAELPQTDRPPPWPPLSVFADQDFREKMFGFEVQSDEQMFGKLRADSRGRPSLFAANRFREISGRFSDPSARAELAGWYHSAPKTSRRRFLIERVMICCEAFSFLYEPPTKQFVSPLRDRSS